MQYNKFISCLRKVKWGSGHSLTRQWLRILGSKHLRNNLQGHQGRWRESCKGVYIFKIMALEITHSLPFTFLWPQQWNHLTLRSLRSKGKYTERLKNTVLSATGNLSRTFIFPPYVDSIIGVLCSASVLLASVLLVSAFWLQHSVHSL